jgi:hypothetical protein
MRLAAARMASFLRRGSHANDNRRDPEIAAVMCAQLAAGRAVDCSVLLAGSGR